MKWLITGGCGFIGSTLVHSLLREGGHAVRIVDNLSVGSITALDGLSVSRHEGVGELDWDEGKAHVHVTDIMNDADALRLAAGADVIVHLAANTGVAPSVENPRMDCVTNVIGTLNYLEAARHNGVQRFVFASSGAPVGEVTPPIHEELVPHPVSPYGASKLCGEAYCSAYFRTYGIETVALRFGNVYGPGSGHKSSVVAKFYSMIMRNETLTIYGDGTQTRDFIYVADLLNAVRAAASTPGIGGEVFQIATSSETQVVELLDEIVRVVTEKGYPKPEVSYTEKRLGDVMRNYSDTSKAARMLGWQAQMALPQGLRETFAWFTQR